MKAGPARWDWRRKCSEMFACPSVCAAGGLRERLRARGNEINQVGSYPWKKYHSQGEKSCPVTSWRDRFTVCYALPASSVEYPWGSFALKFREEEITEFFSPGDHPQLQDTRSLNCCLCWRRLESWICNISASCKKEHLIRQIGVSGNIGHGNHSLPAGKWESWVVDGSYVCFLVFLPCCPWGRAGRALTWVSQAHFFFYTCK